MSGLISLENAKEIIAEGGVLIMPTDTVYGVACDVGNSEAVERISRIKGRELEKSFTIHIAELNMLDEWVRNIPEGARRMMNEYWPGDINIVFPSYRCVPHITKHGEDYDTVAIRMPDHQVPLELSRHLGNAIIGTSANFSGKPAAYSYRDLDTDFVRLTDGVVAGECGGIKVSATVGFKKDGSLQIFREGRLTQKELKRIV